MSNSDDIVLLLERDGGAGENDILFIGGNEAFHRASGYADDELLGQTAAELFPVGSDAAALITAVHGSGSLRSELACSRTSGGTFMLGMNLMSAPARTPGRACFVILGRDISASLQARQMQHSIERLLAKVFSSVDVAVAIVNGAGRIVMTNPKVDQLLSYSSNGLIGLTSMELVAAESRSAIATILKQQILDGKDISYSVPALRADGSPLALRITAVMAEIGDPKQFRILTLRPDTVGTVALHSQNVGRIKLVGLDEVRVALGDRWPASAKQAMATAEAVIKRNCGPQDSFSRADDISFLMCFGSLNEEESSFRAAMIGREIRNRLIGQGEDPDTAYVRSVAALVRFPDLGEAAAPSHAMLLNGLEQQLERLEEKARAVLREAWAGTACDLEQVCGRTAEQVVASTVLLPHALERQVASALAALPINETKAFDPDGLLLGLAAQQAVTSMAHGDTLPVMVRISFDVFATRVATDRFLEMCGKIDPRVGSRLVLLLSSLPSGLPRTRLQDCINRLRPFCRAVGYQVDEVAELPQIDLSNSFNPIVVLPVSACAASSPGKLKDLFGSLQSRRAKVMVRGVASQKDAAALRSLGVDMISMKRLET